MKYALSKVHIKMQIKTVIKYQITLNLINNVHNKQGDRLA